jgi:hypothetical protein
MRHQDTHPALLTLVYSDCYDHYSLMSCVLDFFIWLE